MNEEKELLKLKEYMKKLDDSIEIPDSVSPKEVVKNMKKDKSKIYKYATIAACFVLTVSIIGLMIAVPLSIFDKPDVVSEDGVRYYGIQQSAKSYDEVYSKIHKYQNTYRLKSFIDDFSFDSLFGTKKYDAAVEESVSDSDTGETYIYAGGASQTNVQVNGVDEADFIKNDDRYIYYRRENEIVIVDAQNQYSPELISRISYTEQEGRSANMFLTPDKKLVVIWRELKLDDRIKKGYRMKNTTNIAVYDVKDPKSPKLFRSFSQDGEFCDSRMIGNRLYVISNIRSINPKKGDIASFVPSTADSTTGKDEPVSCEDIMIPESLNSTSYCVISGFDVSKQDPASTKTIFGNSDTVYSTENNLYILTDIYGHDDNVYASTSIERFDIRTADIKPTGRTVIPGTVINQFALDEYKDNLRVGVTVNGSYGTTNAFFVFDESLKMCGSIMGIAPDEDIYSMRFDGDKAYMVTFRQTDPLYAIDASDPTAPKILGKLKVPGFSTYMHPVGDGLLLGIGRDADEFSGMVNEGIKLSLFDVSDMSNPVEIDTEIFMGEEENEDNAYYAYDSSVVANHKLFVDLGGNKYGFPVRYDWYDDDSSGRGIGFLIIKIENREIVIDKLILSPSEIMSCRGIRMDDCIIIFTYEGCKSYQITDYQLKSEIKF